MAELANGLTRCLDEVLDGKSTLGDCLQEHPEFEAELLDLLPVALALGTAEVPELSAGSRARIRAGLLSAIAEPVPSRGLPDPVELIRRLSRPPGWFGLRAVAGGLAAMLSGAVVVYAAQDASPGTLLYPVHEMTQQVTYALVPQIQVVAVTPMSEVQVTGAADSSTDPPPARKTPPPGKASAAPRSTSVPVEVRPVSGQVPQPAARSSPSPAVPRVAGREGAPEGSAQRLRQSGDERNEPPAAAGRDDRVTHDVQSRDGEKGASGSTHEGPLSASPRQGTSSRENDREAEARVPAGQASVAATPTSKPTEKPSVARTAELEAAKQAPAVPPLGQGPSKQSSESADARGALDGHARTENSGVKDDGKHAPAETKQSRGSSAGQAEQKGRLIRAS